MKKYKIIIGIFIFFLITSIILPVNVLAVESKIDKESAEILKKLDTSGARGFLDKVAGGSYETKNITGGSLIDLIGVITLTLISLLGVFFVIKMIYAGYLWMTASGNEEQVTKSKGMITNSIIGIIIVLSAFSISWFALKKFASSTTQVKDWSEDGAYQIRDSVGDEAKDPYDYTQNETTPQYEMLKGWIKGWFK